MRLHAFNGSSGSKSGLHNSEAVVLRKLTATCVHWATLQPLQAHSFYII